MTPTNDHDFQQFRGKFDDALIPDTAFKEKMEKLLQSEKPVEPERTSTVLASPPKKQSQTVVPGRRSHPLMIAVAVLMVFSVVVASVWVLSGDVLEDEYASAPSGVATLPADVLLAPGADVQLSGKPLPNAGSGQWLHTANDDDVLIVTHYGSDPTPESLPTVAALDATSGSVLWEVEEMDLSQITLYDDLIIGIEYQWESTDPWTNASRFLTAIDLDTGSILWQTKLSEPGDDLDRVPTTSPLRVGNTLVIARADGMVHAWNIETGQPEWEHSFGPQDHWKSETIITEDGKEQAVSWMPVATAAWNDQLVITTGDGQVSIVNEDGNLISNASLESLADQSARVFRLETYTMPDGVLVLMGSQSTSRVSTTITAFDPDTGNVTWSREFERELHLDISGDGSIAINSHIWQEYPAFIRIFGLGGYSTFQFMWIDGHAGETILSTDRGKLETAQVTLTDGKYACTRTERNEIVCFDHAGTRHVLEIEPWGDPVLMEGVLYIPTEDGLMKVQLP